MSPSIAIRRLREGELGRLEEEYPDPGAPISRHRTRSNRQHHDAGVYLVAWRGDNPVGWVFVHRPGSVNASDKAGQLDAAEIEDLYVNVPFRGEGHGSALLAAAETVAREKGWRRIGLEVTVSNPHNDVARGMYQRHGYVDSGIGVFESGYYYWTESGEQIWDGEPHLYLIKSLSVDESGGG